MTWKDIFTEIRIKLNLKKKSSPRKLSFQKNTIEEFRNNSSILRSRLLHSIEDRVNARSQLVPYLSTDDRIFEPYVDTLASLVYGEELYSYTFQLGKDVLRYVEDFEYRNRIKVNKRHLYFGLSVNSIYMNDTINGMIYWELSQKDDAITLGVAYNSQQAIIDTFHKFTSVVSPLTTVFNENTLHYQLRNKYAFIEEFKLVIAKQQVPELFSFFSCALRYKQVNYWLKNDFTDMTKMYAQELVNSLCILCEASLKDISLVTQSVLGKILNTDIPNISLSLSNVLGHSYPKPNTGLFATYPTLTDADFNTSLQLIIASIKSLTLSDDEMKAHLIYLTYMLRNNALHDVRASLNYYNNANQFDEVIILLFASASMIRNL